MDVFYEDPTREKNKMNIHGHKLRIAKIKEELKKGERSLGEYNFKRLMKIKNMHYDLIKILRKRREVKKK